MYTIKSKAIATGVIALTLFAAAPVFADTNVSVDDNGLHLGLFAKVLREDIREARQEQRKEAREQEKKHHATSTSATTTKQFTIEGSITAISGTTITLQGARGAAYTVIATNATITGRNNATLSIGSLKIGDKLSVTGSLSGNAVIATKIKSKSDLTGKIYRSVEAGIVTAINGATVTLNNFGASGNTTVTTNTDTKYSVNGKTATSGALTVGSHVLVLGTSSATSTTSVNASIIVIITEGLNWIKHLWR
jgi:hypothetical protein